MVSRRSLLGTVTAGVTAALAGCGGSDRVPAGEDSPHPQASWRQLGRDPTNTRQNTDIAVTEERSPRWETTVDTEIERLDRTGFSTPVSDGTRLYVTRSGPDPAVLALDSADGSVGEVYEPTASPTGAPAVVGDVLLVPLERGVIEALDLRLEETVWARDLGRRAAATGVVTAGERAYVPATGVPGFETDAGVIALDVADGSRVWACRLPERALAGRVPAVDAEGVYVAGSDTVYAIDRGSGALLWETRVLTDRVSGVGVAGDRLVLCGRLTPEADEALLALGTEDGGLRWSHPLAHPNSCWSPAVGPERVYAASERLVAEGVDEGSDPPASTGADGEGTQGRLEAFTHTGERAWDVECPPTRRRPPVVAGDTVSVLGDQRLHLFDRTDGALSATEKRPDVSFATGHSLTPAGLTAVTEDGRLVSGLGGVDA